jgi:hypothetical protein
MIIMLKCDDAEFAEHIYYAYISAKQTLIPTQVAASVDIAWEDLHEVEQKIWRCTATRLLALPAAVRRKRGIAETAPLTALAPRLLASRPIH